MNAAQRIFKNTVALTLAKLLSLANTILMAWLIARTLQATGLGAYSTVMAFFATIRIWADLGISQFIPRDVSRDLSKTNRYVTHLGVLTVVITLVIVAILCSIAPFFNYSKETTYGIYIICLALIPTALLVITDATMVTHERVELITYSQIIENIGNIVGTIYLLSHGYGIIAVFINFTIFRYITLVIRGYLFVRYVVKPRWEFDFSFLKSLAGDLKTFTMLGILSGIACQTEVIVLSVLYDDVEVGHYSAALKLITVWYVIPQSLMGVVFPLLSKSFEQSIEKFQKIQLRAVKYLMAVALPLAAGTLAIGDQIINWFYGPGFEQSVLSLRILALMPVLIFLSGVLWRTLLARNEQGVALRANIICSIVRLATAVFFIYWLGYQGAAIALASAYAFYVLLHFYYVWQCGTPIPFFQITWRFIVAAVIMGLFSWFLGHIIEIRLFFNIPLSAGVFAGLVFLLQGFTQDDYELFKNIAYKRREVQIG